MILIRILQIIGVLAVFFGILAQSMIHVVAGIAFGIFALIEFRFYEEIEKLCKEEEEND